MTSIALISVPRTSISIPSPAIASLKSVAEENKHKAFCIDLNIEIYREFEPREYQEIDNYFQLDLRYAHYKSLKLSDFKDDLSNTTYHAYKEFLDRWSTKILELQSDFIGISLLSVNSVISCFDLCNELKNKCPTCKIILGGPGVSTDGIKADANFGEFLIRHNLADYCIQGEGEYKLLDLLNGVKSKEYKQIEDLDTLPFPDYDDLPVQDYDASNLISITGSRGCVRNCSFCDIKSAWNQYRYRSGKNITQEIIHHYKKYNTTNIQFTDSLINGSLKSFGGFLDAMIESKSKKIIPDNLKWSGQFICRPKNQFREDWYKKMSEAGAGQLYIGIESASESVLHDMGKKLQFSDIEYMMEMLYKYSIQCDILLVIGYPTETREDFEKTKEMLRQFSKYNQEGVISGVNLGKTMVVLPGSPIGQNLNHWGIEYDSNQNWISNKNPDLTFKERLRRRIEIQKVCEDYGYIVRFPLTTLKTLKENLLNNKETV